MLGRRGPHGSAEEAFGYMELAKSRSLAELSCTERRARVSRSGQSGLVRRIREMREELNWYYRRIEKEQLSAEAHSPERIERLQKEALARENDLVRVLREVRRARSCLRGHPNPMGCLRSITFARRCPRMRR